MQAEREKVAYVPAIYVGTKIVKPDYLATVDVDPASKTYGKVIHRAVMPNVGDELHTSAGTLAAVATAIPTRCAATWCSPACAARDPHSRYGRSPRAEIAQGDRTEGNRRQDEPLRPHTVHCLPDGQIMLSMLGDREGNGPGGFLLLDSKFEIAGRWERKARECGSTTTSGISRGIM